MKRGFYTIMSAQFFSSLADNALFVAAVELLRTGGAPEWQRAALVPMFALFYVVLAPFVGAFADALPKGKVMFVSNAIKVVGCLLMLTGLHPLLAYAVVGLGAAAYSPAKYGILTELLPASQLVKANGWIEGLTITSIILGVLVGGQLVAPHIAGVLLDFDLPGLDLGIDLPALGGTRRPLCKTCLDWSVRRSHLAGSLGAAMLSRFYQLNWAKREKGNRVVTFSPKGTARFNALFGAPGD